MESLQKLTLMLDKGCEILFIVNFNLLILLLLLVVIFTLLVLASWFGAFLTDVLCGTGRRYDVQD